jgi:hypothetical protein
MLNIKSIPAMSAIVKILSNINRMKPIIMTGNVKINMRNNILAFFCTSIDSDEYFCKKYSLILKKMDSDFMETYSFPESVIIFKEIFQLIMKVSQ